jgi:hypothetical protein
VDVVLEPLAERAARIPIDDVAGTDPLVVIDDLGRVPITLGDAIGEPHHVGRARDTVVLLVSAIPRAVAANDQSLHGRLHR